MPVTSGTYANVESEVYGYLTNNGFNKATATGILANISKESGFNPSAYNSSEGAYGLCQWRGSRRDALFSKYGNNPSVKDQVSFIIYELNSSEKTANSRITGITNDSDGAKLAGYNFARYYERCNSNLYTTRATGALEFWNYYSDDKNKVPIPTGDVTINITGDPLIDGTGSQSPSTISTPWKNGYSEQILSNLTEVAAAGFDKGYLYELNTGNSFTFYIPEFTETAGANWTPINIPGRSVQILSYESTSSRKVTISLDLYAGVGMYEGSSEEEVMSKLHNDANFLKSLEYPEYQGIYVIPPSTVHLILGSAFSMIGVVNDVSVEHLKPLDSQNRSMYLKVSFTVTQVAENPPDCFEIRGGVNAMRTSGGRIDNSNTTTSTTRPAIDYTTDTKYTAKPAIVYSNNSGFVRS